MQRASWLIMCALALLIMCRMCSDLITSERWLDYIDDSDWDYMRICARSCCHYLRID